MLLDNAQDLGQCAEELDCTVGQLLTPLTRYRLRSGLWAIDNGGYSGMDIPAFLALLNREQHHCEECLFVAVPDVVGSARRTLEVFERWKPQLSDWKLALVCQDGQEDLPLPWDDIAAVFIGGSTNWKLSPHVEHIVRAAKALNKWVHIGRINDPCRFKHFEKMGADSCDGTGIARYTHMREAIAQRDNQGDIFNAAT
ncbi:hypothetical protein ACULN0_03985 [Pectobacterium actinidiae]|uniref:hypothetical protein n=1 Tax=Pectobacterium actinidiae TaxID=1507808 RepID=UPI004040B426